MGDDDGKVKFCLNEDGTLEVVGDPENQFWSVKLGNDGIIESISRDSTTYTRAKKGSKLNGEAEGMFFFSTAGFVQERLRLWTGGPGLTGELRTATQPEPGCLWELKFMWRSAK